MRAGWLRDDYVLLQDSAHRLAALEHDPVARRDAVDLASRIGTPLGVSTPPWPTVAKAGRSVLKSSTTFVIE